METVLETSNLTKRFDATTALDAVDLAVPAGELVGLVGRNGSGKTTANPSDPPSRWPSRPSRPSATSRRSAWRDGRRAGSGEPAISAPDTGKWIRASLYEQWGDAGWADVASGLRFLPMLLLIFGLDAVIDSGGRSYGEAFANVAYHAFFRPPGEPFGDKGDPHLMVAFLIGLAGAFLAFLNSAAVEEGRPFPLSRADRGRIAFKANLVTSALFLLVAGAGAFLFAQAAAWAAGLPLRLDFVPFFARAILATLLAMPAVFWLRLRTDSFQNRPPGERALVTALWSFAMLIWVTLWCYVIAPLVLKVPAIELPVSLGLILLAFAIYNRSLEHHFATADLA